MTVPTDSPAAPAWPSCQAEDGCRGAQLGGSSACLAHLNESELVDLLFTLKPGSDLDLRGTQVEGKRLARLLTALYDEYGRLRLGSSQFNEAQFTGITRFNEAQFTGDADFSGAQFHGDAWFLEAQFTGIAKFHRAQFSAGAQFVDAKFTGDAQFLWVQFGGVAAFSDAKFTEAAFGDAKFTGDAWFDGTQFAERAEFTKVQFTAGPCSMGPSSARTPGSTRRGLPVQWFLAPCSSTTP
jgi:uncharacterized protein YjbI with pentapeptide repeats